MLIFRSPAAGFTNFLFTTLTKYIIRLLFLAFLPLECYFIACLKRAKHLVSRRLNRLVLANRFSGSLTLHRTENDLEFLEPSSDAEYKSNEYSKVLWESKDYHR